MSSLLGALIEAADAILPTAVVGFTRVGADGRAGVLCSTRSRLSAYAVPPGDVPPAMRPMTDGAIDGIADVDAAALAADEAGAIAWVLRDHGVQRIVAVPSAGARLWFGFSSDRALTADARARLAALADTPAGRFPGAVAEELDGVDALRRLERVAALQPAMIDAVDPRGLASVLDGLRDMALPHDDLELTIVDDDLARERHHGGTAAGRAATIPQPAAVVQAWQYDVVDDDADDAEAPAGCRSSLRLPVRFRDRTLGRLAFHARQPSAYGRLDFAVGRRVADHVAMALEHRRLVEESRRAAVLQERTANLDLVDGLVRTITGVLDVREVFDRIFEVSQRALPHDAMSIAVPSADFERVTLHARTGALRHLPVPSEVPLTAPKDVPRPWDHMRVDDLTAQPILATAPAIEAGMRALLTIPVRVEERLGGWVSFWSATPGRFTEDDVPIARRIAAHIALAFSHHRLAEEGRAHEELRARTTNLELLDALLVALTDSGDLRDVFERLSGIAAKVLPHDACALLVHEPDGRHGRVYASTGYPPGLPDVVEIPPELLDDPDWDHDVFADMRTIDGPVAAFQAAHGLRALLRVPIQLDGRFAGALTFSSRTIGAFTEADVLVARRMADRLAVGLARDRVLEASRRADEAAARAARLEARVRTLTEELDARTGYRRVVGESAEWRQVLTQATQVASTETTVLLLGESGTGKEVVARFLHRGSTRNKGPFVALNCAALPEQLLEAELFGYERGAYTGATQSKPGQLEQASGGTLFLDEVGEMTLPAQAKFLRVLQEREFQRLGGTRVLRTDARIVAATNRDLRRAIANGQFREDLYYRLNVFAIHLPPLRQRRDDVLPLSEAFLNEIGRGLGRPPAGISREAREQLVAYAWPGNVRELRNILERAAILCDGGLITSQHLAIGAIAPPVSPSAAAGPAPTSAAATASPPARAEAPAATAPTSASDLEAMERTMIEQALQSARFNKSKAARALGLTRRQLYARLAKYDLE